MNSKIRIIKIKAQIVFFGLWNNDKYRVTQSSHTPLGAFSYFNNIFFVIFGFKLTFIFLFRLKMVVMEFFVWFYFCFLGNLLKHFAFISQFLEHSIYSKNYICVLVWTEEIEYISCHYSERWFGNFINGTTDL